MSKTQSIIERTLEQYGGFNVELRNGKIIIMYNGGASGMSCSIGEDLDEAARTVFNLLLDVDTTMSKSEKCDFKKGLLKKKKEEIKKLERDIKRLDDQIMYSFVSR